MGATFHFKWPLNLAPERAIAGEDPRPSTKRNHAGNSPIWKARRWPANGEGVYGAGDGVEKAGQKPENKPFFSIQTQRRPPIRPPQSFLFGRMWQFWPFAECPVQSAYTGIAAVPEATACARRSRVRSTSTLLRARRIRPISAGTPGSEKWRGHPHLGCSMF